MDLSPITDFFTNIKEKVTNPFFGTLIIVSIARNWDLVYSLFNFSDKSSRIYKIQYIRNYLVEKNIFYEATINVLWASGIVLVGYFFVVTFRSLSTAVEFNLWPYLTKKLINKKTKLKSDYDELESDRDKFAEIAETQRQRVQILTKDHTSLSQAYQTQVKLNSELRASNSELQISNTELTEDHRQMYDDLNAIIIVRDSTIMSLEKEINLLANSSKTCQEQLHISREQLSQRPVELLDLKKELNDLKLENDKQIQFGLSLFMENKAKATQPLLMKYPRKVVLEIIDKNNTPLFMEGNGALMDSVDAFKCYVQQSGIISPFVDHRDNRDIYLRKAIDAGIEIKDFDENLKYIR